MTTRTPIKNAALSWDENGQPISSQFNDVYFTRVSGLKESRYVFIEQNDLPERFSKLPEDGVFTIAETGFGTGLNFLCTWQCFLEHAPKTARLHFVSVEKFPLSRYDLTKALALWPELREYAGQLLQQYPGNMSGFHRRNFHNNRIHLTLIIADIHDALPNIEGQVNAWFLDGFAPSKNPDMWQPELFQNMVAKSTPNASYSTFTVAQMVRHGIADAGLTMTRVPGFGKKREIIRGTIPPSTQQENKPWLKPAPAPRNQNQAIVIGAGLAGASTARALADRGWNVTVLDKKPSPASGASGNPQGMLYTRLSAHDTPLTQLVLQGYRHSINTFTQLPGNLYNPVGIVQLPDSEKEETRQQQLIGCGHFDSILTGKTAKDLSQIAGTDIPQDGLWFEDGGWVSPPAVVKTLLEHSNITFRGECSVKTLDRTDDHWILLLENGEELNSPVVIIACGHQANELSQTSHLPLKSIRGQITVVPATESSQKLKTVLCEEGYIAPAASGQHTLGATFHFHDKDENCRSADHQANLNTIKSFAPSVAKALEFDQLNPEELEGRTGFRCTTPDYLPVVGPVMDEPKFKQRFAALEKNAKTRIEQPMLWLEGLYINAGHGSRGLVTCPLAGEILACQITGEMSPTSMNLVSELHPGRFPARKLIKGKKKS
ncbi:bifunctional tRNA (5-methylaminomethyl-2-thiouridine)(34)-methyltransferase MnmD/FAD-dependent 5-carboxymethylaminomethyl-2-thiouridine(34) oxidoreductase MnmC [Parendozoicomonas sp. Alg238-R29]|uniref:bifunctional tRNA (5-methylaminomethyl-2-thiouridine)(34)-methyltransferase MnmD/FAD-dependent 5-carboxymethylaminomethyl-2-thiouridine(34) oxidoreductase MnmC n=1 Tax=Parendozoicomonas sp. Alg238-R29 TaxID=2993446 RepID=UPI00248E2C97|nr:bifunctional tRNA (5-methylaminomethyl-2-thiouridine)(34)-methyltransferase MnmD/FAD-dependent 5-carboxymethylaminomethyl-2-thiouridine(34) oxidoreductase MnmC [Parendozoicomonas sp. Alg238-R29]